MIRNHLLTAWRNLVKNRVTALINITGLSVAFTCCILLTSLSWSIFLASGLATLLIALLTVGVQTVRAAVMNPVKSLRTE